MMPLKEHTLVLPSCKVRPVLPPLLDDALEEDDELVLEALVLAAELVLEEELVLEVVLLLAEELDDEPFSRDPPHPVKINPANKPVIQRARWFMSEPHKSSEKRRGKTIIDRAI
jgi:hypothetical protein